MTEIIEGSAVVLSDEPAEILTDRSEWNGDNPFFLIIELDPKPESGNVGIDLDTPGWHTDNAGVMRSPGTWWLVHKASQVPVMGMVVNDGDQPYYTRHHVGNVFTTSEVTAHGIGKKNADGSVFRLWLLPNGVICGGDDVDTIASRMVNG